MTDTDTAAKHRHGLAPYLHDVAAYDLEQCITALLAAIRLRGEEDKS